MLVGTLPADNPDLWLRSGVVVRNHANGRGFVRCRALLEVGACATHPEITTQLRCPVCTAPMICWNG